MSCVRSIAHRLTWLLVAALPALPISKDESLSSVSVRRWGQEIGMPEETITAVLATPDGYVWLTSNHGLIRFDGSRAVVLHPGASFRSRGTGECSSSSLSALRYRPGGSLWVGSASGCLFQIVPDRFGSFASFQLRAYSAADSRQENSGVLHIWPVEGSTELIVVRRSQIARVETKVADGGGQGGDASLKLRPIVESVIAKAPAGTSIQLAAIDERQRIWAVMTDRTLYELNASTRQWERLSELPGTPRRMVVDRLGTIWVATTRGVLRWNRKGSRIYKTSDGLAQGDTSGVLEDHAGCLWFTHDANLSRLCGERMETLPMGMAEEEMPTVMDEDAQGNIWIGGRWGNLYRVGSPLFRSYTKREGLPESHVTGVTIEEDGSVWASLRQRGVVKIDRGSMVQPPQWETLQEVQAILAKPRGGILAATPTGVFEVNGKGATPLRLRGPLEFRSLAALYWGGEGELLYSNVAGNYRLRQRVDGWQPEALAGPPRIRQWANGGDGATYGVAQYQGLYRLDGDRYVTAEGISASRARGWYSLASDREGLLWVGTTEGLDLYSPRERRLLTQQQLLHSDHIFHIVEDAYGKIWCSTRAGLVRFSRAQALEIARSGKGTLQAERYGEAQMLPTTNFGLVTSASGAKDRQGRLWFPGLQGLVTVMPSDLERVPKPPKPFLLEMRSDGVTGDLDSELRLPAGVKKIEFLFRTVRMDPLGGDFCRMRMIGFDPGWIPCASSGTAQYTNLAPGSYEFLLQTSSISDPWNGPVLKLPFQIEAHFHQLIWVRVGSVLLLLALGVALLARREAVAKQRTRELEAKVEERTQNLEQATQAAQAANRAKTEFLATMSHEIRTPMNGVLGAVQMLAESELQADQRKLVSVIRQSGEDLVGIVDDILSLSKVEAGKLVLETVATPLAPLCENLIALFLPKSHDKGIHLSLEIGPGVPALILTDPQRLRQILLNLVGNAVKFTETGEVRLLVTSNRDTQTITFQVEDTGVGIADNRIPTLFDPFVQADSSTTRKFGGTGLGLAIVSRFVEAMRGSIEVESEVGMGSKFRVHIPLEVPAVQPVAAPVVKPKIAIPVGLTVLLAEDNAVNQMVCQRMLARLGCQVVTATDGKQALELAQRRRVDLVLMDCQMPVLDGFSATRQLRALGGAFEQLPIIAITASAMAEDRDQCLAAGMNDFLSKPLMMAALEEKLAQWATVVSPSRG